MATTTVGKKWGGGAADKGRLVGKPCNERRITGSNSPSFRRPVCVVSLHVCHHRLKTMHCYCYCCYHRYRYFQGWEAEVEVKATTSDFQKVRCCVSHRFHIQRMCVLERCQPLLTVVAHQRVLQGIQRCLQAGRETSAIHPALLDVHQGRAESSPRRLPLQLLAKTPPKSRHQIQISKRSRQRELEAEMVADEEVAG